MVVLGAGVEFWGGLDLPCMPLVDGCGSQLGEAVPELVGGIREGLVVCIGGCVVVVAVLVVVEVGIEEVGAGVCLRRTSVTVNTELLASMSDGGVGGWVLRGSTSLRPALVKSSSRSSSCCSRASCSMIPSNHTISSNELSVELSMTSFLIWGETVAVGRCSRCAVLEGKVSRPFVP